MDQPVTIPAQQQEDTPQYFADESTPTLTPSPDVADIRSQKAYLGLGDATQQSYDDIYSRIKSGQEQEFRESAASNLTYKASQALEQTLIDARNKKGSPLDYDEALKIVDPYNPSNKPADPKDVIEKAYSQKALTMTNIAAASIDSSIVGDAAKEAPEILATAQAHMSRMLSRIEFARTMKENVENEINNQSYLGWTADFAKNLFQPYVEAKLRGNVEGVGAVSGGLLLGNNLKSQGDAIFNNPTDEGYQNQLTSVIDKLKKDNPQLASQLLDYVIGTGSNDRILQNVFTILSPSDYAQGFNLSKSLLRKIELNNRVNTAFKQILKDSTEAGKDIPVRAALEESMGDVKSAAVTRASDDLAKTLTGSLDPTKDIKDLFTTNFRLDADAASSSPGPLSRDETTFLKDSFLKAGDNLYDRIVNILRVNRTPVPLASRQAIEDYQKVARAEYEGRDLLDIGNPIREPVSNTYHIPFTFGDADGRLFADPETALNYAKTKGWEQPKIVPHYLEGSGEVENPEAFQGRTTFNGLRKDQVEEVIRNSKAELAKTSPGPEAALLRKHIAEHQEGLKMLQNQPASGTPKFGITISPGKTTGKFSDLRDIARLEKSIPVTSKYLEDIRARASKRFIGPHQPGDANQLRQEITSVKEILARDQARLKELRGKTWTTDPVVQQHGLGYKIVVIRPYRETSDVVRNWLIKDETALSTSSLTGWGAWKNSILGRLRSADDTLAFNESINRKVATFTQNAIKEWASKEAKDIEAISNQTRWYKPWGWYKKFSHREVFNQFNETLKFAKSARDPSTGDVGYFFKTPQELNDHYQRYYQRNVTFPEVKAYFAHVKLVEGNRVLSEIAEFRNRSRLGAEQHRVSLINPEGVRESSQFFDGVQRNEFPNGGGQILILGSHKGDERLYHLGANEIPGKILKQFRESVETGRTKIIEIYDPDTYPLRDFVDGGGERIRYVMHSDVETKPLGFNHINRRGGGHYDYDATQFIKQADVVDENAGDAATDKRRVFKRIYKGDKTFLAGSGVKTQDEDIAKKMTKMNSLMKSGDIDGAKDLSKTLGIPFDMMRKWYDPNNVVNGKRVGAFINWDEPFYVVPRNKRIYDLDTKGLVDRLGGENTFQDTSKTGSLAKQFQVEYSQARDAEHLFTINDVGTPGNPIYSMQRALFVDPIPTMNRALNRAIRSTFMDDYKISAVETWLREASPHLKAEESEIRAAPFYHFYNADQGAFTTGTDPAIVNNLLSNRFKIQQFVGMPNQVETAIHGATQLLADQFYRTFGPENQRNVFQKAITIVPLWALSKWEDPISGLRSLAFNAKLGLFALPQFLVQSQTFANIWALGGRSGAHGTFATMLHEWSRVNRSEKFMKAYDDLYTKLNLFGQKPKPGEFIEANRELARTGFEHVGGEYQLNDDVMQHKFIKNEWNNFLDAGQVFFREGEKATRLGAWYTAFREYREAFPHKVLTDADRATILNRADIYTANMSRASASALNSSIFSLPMQFLTYQVRLAELFFGKRLGNTAGERALARARLLGVYAAMYGAPGALGVLGYPFGDSVREAAINKGYVPGSNQFTDAVMNGLISWQMALISGKGDYQKGTQEDVQGRWGTQGFTSIRESMRSDKTVWSLIGGAGVDTFMSTIAHVDPFWQFARQIVSDDEEGNQFKLKPADFLNLFSEFSGPDLIGRGVYAIHTGRWISKNGQYVEDTTPSDVLFREITGIKTQDESDISLFRDIKNNEKTVQQQAERLIIKDYQRGLDAVKDKDYDSAQTFFERARARMIASGIPVDRRTEIMAEATKGYEPQTLTSQWNWATKNVPLGEEATRLDAITRRLKLQQYRNP